MAVKRLEYILILLGVFAFFLFFTDYLSFYVLLFFILVPVISLILTLISGIRLEVSAECQNPGTVRKGETIFLRFRFRGAFRLGGARVRMKICVRNELLQTEKRDTLMFMMGKPGQTVSYALSSDYCGQLEIEILQVRLYDYLWIFGFSGTCGQNKLSVPVMPDIRPLDILAEERQAEDWESDEYSKVKPGDDPAEIFDIRAYRAGDRISRIHWKLSGKRNELMIKEGGLPVGSRMLVVLDMTGTAGKARLADGLLEAAASLSWYLAENGIPHRTGCWQGGEKGGFFLEEVDGNEDFYRSLWGMLRACGEHDRKAVLQGCLEAKNISRILYFAAELSPEETEILCGGQVPVQIFALRGEARETEAERKSRETAERLGARWRDLTAGRITEDMAGLEI